MRTKEEFEASVAAQRARPDVVKHDTEKTRCPACWNEQEARVDEDGDMTSSCVYCGYVLGKYENYEVREVATRGAAKFEVTAKRHFVEP